MKKNNLFKILSFISIMSYISIGNEKGSNIIGNKRAASVLTNTATGERAIALGEDAKASANRAIAIGGDSESSGQTSIAIGAYSKANSQAAVAIGEGAKASSDSSVAIGSLSKALENSSISIGKNSEVKKENSIAIGKEISVEGENAIAIGLESWIQSKDGIAIGKKAKSAGEGAVALGSEAEATMRNAIALGNGAVALGENTVSLGGDAMATSKNTIAIGIDSKAEKESSIALGSGARSSKKYGISLGENSKSTGNSAISIGQKSISKNSNSIAIGTSATSNIENSVALGAESETTVAKPTSEIVKPRFFLDYKDFAGSNPYGVVSIGSKGKERQLQYVAAGQISKESTDAVNGSQLFSVISNFDAFVASMKSVIGNVALLNRDGILHTLNIGNTGKNNIHDAMKSLKDKIDENRNRIEKIENTEIKLGGDKNTSTEGQKIGENNSNNGSNIGNQNQNKGKEIKFEIVKKENSEHIETKARGNKVEIDLTQKAKEDIKSGKKAKEIIDNKGLTFKGDKGETNIQKLGDTLSITGGSYITTKAKGNEVSVDLTDKTKKDIEKGVAANSGVANAVAMANLPQINGKGHNIAGSYGYYNGEHAFALGLSGTNEKVNLTYRASGSLNTRGNISLGAGLGYQFDNISKRNKELLTLQRNGNINLLDEKVYDLDNKVKTLEKRVNELETILRELIKK
ncbi:YadA-like family protein [Streptobacillus ratti]|uniref:YadA-like family protein n=1 Tax=Streptobacillus ratti TaxID=1720557 RepID=UPI0009349BE3|nr:YadA-like family protein [Streptobacillus ratti]